MTTILVPIDDSEQADRAFEFALDTYAAASLHLLHVTDLSDTGHLGGVETGVTYPNPEAYDRIVEEEVAILDEYVARAEAAGVEVRAVHEVGEPARAIVDYADDHDVDHVVIGSHGRTGISRILLGSVAEKVIRRAAVPVTVVR